MVAILYINMVSGIFELYRLHQLPLFPGEKFDIFDKIAVNGACTHPLYTYLKEKKPGIGAIIKWNYTKFLIGRNGVPVKRYGPSEAPLEAEDDIKKELENGVENGSHRVEM